MAPDIGVTASRNFVQSLERGLAVIEAFDDEHPVLGLSDVARRTNLSRATARRFLLTLTELGYMRNDDGRFSLRPRVLGLGYAYLSSLTLPEIALPHLRELSAEARESASLAVLDDEMIVYIAQVTAPRPMAVRINVGTRFPAYPTGMGRVLLAHRDAEWLDNYLATVTLESFTPMTVSSRHELRTALAEVRRAGFAHVVRELDSSLSSIAVPIRHRDGLVVAAIAMSTHTRSNDNSETVESELLPRLRSAARRIEADLHMSATGPGVQEVV